VCHFSPIADAGYAALEDRISFVVPSGSTGRGARAQRGFKTLNEKKEEEKTKRDNEERPKRRDVLSEPTSPHRDS